MEPRNHLIAQVEKRAGLRLTALIWQRESRSGMSALAREADDGGGPFDVPALTGYLESQIAGFRGPIRLQRFKGGQSNPSYLLSTPDQRYVLRSKPAPASQLLPSAHAVAREFRLQSALAGSAVPVAKMYCLCKDESIIGRTFYVMEFIEGRIFWDKALPYLEPAGREAIYDELNRVIAELHRVNYTALGLSDYGAPGDYFTRQIDRWTRQLRGSQTKPVEAMNRLMAWLPQNVPACEDRPQVTLVHGDYRIDNVIFHPTEPRILAVIDWELSTLGHPLADFAYHLLSWHMPCTSMGGLGGLDLPALGIPDTTHYVAAYERRSGTSVTQDWNFYLAYNAFRLAAIAQGIARRVDQGVATGPQAAMYARQVTPLAELGWAFAQRVSPSHGRPTVPTPVSASAVATGETG